MKEFEIFISGHDEIDFAPDSIPREVIQNVRNIIATPKYSAPLFRDFGLNETITDSPVNIASQKLKSEIILAIRKYEPRAKVSYIDFTPGHDGKLSLRLRITIQEDS